MNYCQHQEEYSQVQDCLEQAPRLAQGHPACWPGPPLPQPALLMNPRMKRWWLGLGQGELAY